MTVFGRAAKIAAPPMLVCVADSLSPLDRPLPAATDLNRFEFERLGMVGGERSNVPKRQNPNSPKTPLTGARRLRRTPCPKKRGDTPYQNAPRKIDGIEARDGGAARRSDARIAGGHPFGPGQA